MAEDNNPEQEFIVIPEELRVSFKWAEGYYFSRFYHQLRERGKMVTVRCPGCRRILLPPKPVCGVCKIPVGDDWVELSGKGTVLDFAFIQQPMVDPRTGKMFSEKYPQATILLDEGPMFCHFLEETDPEKLKEGMRVQVVLRAKEEMLGDLADIKFFRAIPE